MILSASGLSGGGGGEWVKIPTPSIPKTSGALDPLLMGFLGEGWPIKIGSEAPDASRVEEAGIFATSSLLTRPLSPTLVFQMDKGRSIWKPILGASGEASVTTTVSQPLSACTFSYPMQEVREGRGWEKATTMDTNVTAALSSPLSGSSFTDPLSCGEIYSPPPDDNNSKLQGIRHNFVLSLWWSICI